jgi:hypothetical protein
LAADNQNSDPESERIQSIDSLAERQNRVEGKLDQLLNMVTGGGKLVSHGQAQQDTEDRLDRPSSVAEQVRAELAKAEQDRASRSAAEDEKAEREQMKADLAALREKPPAPPQPRRQRVMWGSR